MPFGQIELTYSITILSCLAVIKFWCIMSSSVFLPILIKLLVILYHGPLFVNLYIYMLNT